jgi:hypothetical protein
MEPDQTALDIEDVIEVVGTFGTKVEKQEPAAPTIKKL